MPYYKLGAVLPIAAGFAISIIYILAATAFAANLDFVTYPEIRYICDRLGTPELLCRQDAISAGLVTLTALVAAAAVTAVAYRVALVKATGTERQHALTMVSIVVSAVAGGVCSAHVLHELISQSITSRASDININGAWISLENLLWPLMLQLLVITVSIRARLTLIAALLLVAALSPFRGVIFAIALFGGALPLAIGLSEHTLQKKWLYVAAALVVLAGMLGAILIAQTVGRLDDSNPTVVARALSQRIAMPLFQAYAAKKIGADERLPSFADNLGAKLRLSRSPNLNRFLYKRLYGVGTGETTALYYGEGVANFGPSPLLWIFGATLIPVLLSLGLAQYGIAVGVIADIAIWRGSLGGISDVLPAMLIQAGLLIALLYLFKASRLPRLLHRLVAAIIFAAAVGNTASGYLTSQHLQVVAQFKLSPEATASVLRCGRIVETFNRRANEASVSDTAVITSAGIFENTLTIYAGTKTTDKDMLYRLFTAVEADMDQTIRRCDPDAQKANRIRFDYSYVKRVDNLALIDILAFAAACIALIFSFRRPRVGRPSMAEGPSSA